jgi:hypothetical protein
MKTFTDIGGVKKMKIIKCLTNVMILKNIFAKRGGEKIGVFVQTTTY